MSPDEKEARLTVDVSVEFLDGGRLELVTKRARNFFNALERHPEREMRGVAGEDAGALVLTRTDDAILVRGLAPERFFVGDRLIFRASVSRPLGTYEQLDGSAVFVRHVIERADYHTRRRIAALVPGDGLRAGGLEERRAWARARDAVIEILFAQELHGLPSVSALVTALNKTSLVLLVNGDERVSAAEILDETADARDRMTSVLVDLMYRGGRHFGLELGASARLELAVQSVQLGQPFDPDSIAAVTREDPQ